MESLVSKITQMVEKLPENQQNAVYEFVQDLGDNPPSAESELTGKEAFEKLKQYQVKFDGEFDRKKDLEERLYEKYINIG
ncbi:MAG: hypothetical protein FWG64_13760 [Firmicutes bacterium]|nr:hypothetical protein [Bacillota bacterium]